MKKVMFFAVALFLACTAPADTIYAVGDSITKGTNITNPYPKTVSAWTGMPAVNLGIGGTQLAEEIAAIYGVQPMPSDKVLLLTGYNDMRYFGATTAHWEQSLRAVLAWLATSTKYTAQSLAATGAWTNVSSTVNPIGRWSATAGSTLTATTRGAVVYVGSIQQTNLTGSFLVSVDGVDYGPYQTQGGTTYAGGKNYGPVLIRIDGLADTTHSVVVKVLSGRVYCDWIGHPTPGPSVYAGEVLRMRATSYALGAPFNKGSDAAVAAYTAALQAHIATLTADGLTITFVPLKYDPATQVLTSDRVHPSENGQATMAISWLKAMGY